MNFQQAFNNPGTWVSMRGTPTDYRIQAPNQYGPWALGKLCDDAGQIVDVAFSGSKKQELPQESLLNVQCLWAVRYDANKQQTKALFNGHTQQAASQASQAPQAPPQTPQNAPQSTNPAQAAQQAKERSIERQVAVKAVSEIVVAEHLNMAQAAQWLEFYANFMETGSTETPMETGPANWDPKEDDPPF